MGMRVNAVENAEREIAESEDPLIRFFTVKNTARSAPQDNLTGSWRECGPDTAGDFSAVGYFFGRELPKARQVPIGLINASLGATGIPCWMSKKSLQSSPKFAEILAEHEWHVLQFPKKLKEYKENLSAYNKKVAAAKKEGRPEPQKPKEPRHPSTHWQSPVGRYNGMIAPLHPFAIRGAIWYQGESNAAGWDEYRELFPVMVNDWRESWGCGDFPFLFVQLTSFAGKELRGSLDQTWPFFREAQTDCLAVKNTGMAVAIDVGDRMRVHAPKKQPVGRRLALAARKIAYGEDLVYSGPVFESLTIWGEKAIVKFSHTGSGLLFAGGEAKGFEICGEDRKFAPARAEISGDKVIVSSPDVPGPLAVRYGWKGFSDCNLFNKERLPACPFRTDSFPAPERTR